MVGFFTALKARHVVRKHLLKPEINKEINLCLHKHPYFRAVKTLKVNYVGLAAQTNLRVLRHGQNAYYGIQY
jgi:hypothetical protein